MGASQRLLCQHQLRSALGIDLQGLRTGLGILKDPYSRQQAKGLASTDLPEVCAQCPDTCRLEPKAHREVPRTFGRQRRMATQQHGHALTVKGVAHVQPWHLQGAALTQGGGAKALSAGSAHHQVWPYLPAPGQLSGVDGAQVTVLVPAQCERQLLGGRGRDLQFTVDRPELALRVERGEAGQTGAVAQGFFTPVQSQTEFDGLPLPFAQRA